MKKYLIAGIVGIGLAVISAQILFVGSGLTLLPWAIAGLTIGYFTNSKRQALSVGFTYGFLLGFTFMVVGYDGPDSITSKLLPFAALGLFSAMCGLILGIVGYFIGRKFR